MIILKYRRIVIKKLNQLILITPYKKLKYKPLSI